jgi:hypothetical protein
MKSLTIFIITIILITGCNKGGRTTKNIEAKKDEVTQTQLNTNENPATTTKKTDSTNKISVENLIYDTDELPDDVRYSGKIIAGARWNDKNGVNILLITETPEKGQSGDNRMKELFGYHYVTGGGETKLLWKINDFVKDCPVDLTLKYIDGSLLVTDLDINGIAETSFLYRMSCKGDVSPDDMKLLMHEGKTKYAIRGQMKLTIKGEGTYGGEMKIDPSFDKAPDEFLDFAKERWNKYMEETVGY